VLELCVPPTQPLAFNHLRRDVGQVAPGYSSGIAPRNVVVTIVDTFGAAH
jgi:hypothetical protein